MESTLNMLLPNQLFMRKMSKLMLCICCLIQFKVTFGQVVAVQVNINQKQAPDLYSDVKQYNSKYVSQYVPGLVETKQLIDNKIADIVARDKANNLQNQKSLKNLLIWLTDIKNQTPPFYKDAIKVWGDYTDEITSYYNNHNDFSFSSKWINNEIEQINTEVTTYNKLLPVIYRDQGYEEYKKNNYKQSVIYLSNALELDPTLISVFGVRGAAYYYLGKEDLALVDLNKAIVADEKNIVEYNLRGLIELHLKNYSKAIDDFSNSIELAPTDANLYFNRADAKNRLRDYTGSISDYTKVLELKSDFIEAYYNRAEIKSTLKDYFGAISDYTKLIGLQPDTSDAYYLRGYAKFQLKNYKDALSDYNKSIQIGKDDKTGYRFRAELKLVLQDYRGCVEDCNIMIASEPKSPNTLFFRGQAYYKLGQKMKACADWSKSGELGNKDAYLSISKYCQ